MSENNLSNIILERLNRMNDRLKNIEQDASTIKTDMTIVKEAVIGSEFVIRTPF